MELEYRRFLTLMKKYPHEQTSPLVDVDMFWHYHILDTMKYAADCEAVFGYFLHHFPYVGMRGEEDEGAFCRNSACACSSCTRPPSAKLTFGKCSTNRDPC